MIFLMFFTDNYRAKRHIQGGIPAEDREGSAGEMGEGKGELNFQCL
jgi:hypothetical protein